MSKKQNNTDLIYNNKVDKMRYNVVKIEKPESCRGCPVSDHNHISGGYAVMTDSVFTKICSKCKVEKPVSEYYKRTASKDGLAAICKTCESIRCKAYQKENSERLKSYRKKHYEGNIELNKIKRKKYYQENAERIKARVKAYRESNPEKVAECVTKSKNKNPIKYAKMHKEWYENNFENVQAQKKLYREENIIEFKEREKAYRNANPEKIKAYKDTHKKEISASNKAYYRLHRDEKLEYNKRYFKTPVGKIANKKNCHRYRATKLNVTVEDFNPFDVLERDSYKCQICGIKTNPNLKSQYHPKYPNLDHIIPLSKGGEHSRKNTQCLCRQCNMEKHNKENFGDQMRLF
jgi:5-methylcytosine-specific restriction endonuclease McrA